MKQILITLLLTFCCTGFIMHESYGQLFVRIYNDKGKKILKGTIDYATDSFIVIVRKNKVQELLFIKEIAFIKTKKSFGSYIVGGAAAGIIISVTSTVELGAEWESIPLGTAAGTFAGTICGMVTKREKFIIKGSIEKWKPVKYTLASRSKKDILSPG